MQEQRYTWVKFAVSKKHCDEPTIIAYLQWGMEDLFHFRVTFPLLDMDKCDIISKFWLYFSKLWLNFSQLWLHFSQCFPTNVTQISHNCNFISHHWNNNHWLWFYHILSPFFFHNSYFIIATLFHIIVFFLSCNWDIIFENVTLYLTNWNANFISHLQIFSNVFLKFLIVLISYSTSTTLFHIIAFASHSCDYLL